MTTPSPRPTRVASPVEGTEGVSDEAKRQAIRGIDRRERQVGLIAAGLAGVIALSTTLPYVLKPSMKVSVTVAASKNHTCAKHYQYVNGKCDGKVAYSLDHWVFAMCILLAFRGHDLRHGAGWTAEPPRLRLPDGGPRL